MDLGLVFFLERVVISEINTGKQKTEGKSMLCKACCTSTVDFPVKMAKPVQWENTDIMSQN